MKKRILVIVLAISFILPISVYANDTRPFVHGDSEIINTVYDANELKNLEERIKKIHEDYVKIFNQNLRLRGYNDGSEKTLAVTPFEQENGHYCGPATVKQVVHFIKGNSLSQNEYASMIGTDNGGSDMTAIANIIPSLTGLQYKYHTFSDSGDWISKIFDGINAGRPSILDINTLGVPNWPYRTEGHFVNTSGYSTTHEFKIRITDPFGPGFGNRWYSMLDVYTANRSHRRSAIIW